MTKELLPGEPMERFIRAGKIAKMSFEEWAQRCDENFLRDYFSRMAKISNHLDSAIRVAEEIQRESV